MGSAPFRFAAFSFLLPISLCREVTVPASVEGASLERSCMAMRAFMCDDANVRVWQCERSCEVMHRIERRRRGQNTAGDAIPGRYDQQEITAERWQEN